ncbi:hypothetical protein [Actinophytocola sp.]|uniref:8-oxoguanine DNA glycosylase OGG fold protein n=1 Tax=Actinophytocola sp. TaxID=1872138 RepID=UPI0039C8AE36
MWSRTSWRAFLPDHVALLDRLPNPIGRADVTAAVRECLEQDAVPAFVAAMVWGYGRVGYGPFRTARVLTDNPGAPTVLREAAHRVRRDGGPSAFGWLAEHRLAWLGVAFATKFLFYCSQPPATPALVLDRLVQGWLREHAQWRVRLDWHVADYQAYVPHDRQLGHRAWTRAVSDGVPDVRGRGHPPARQPMGRPAAHLGDARYAAGCAGGRTT